MAEDIHVSLNNLFSMINTTLGQIKGMVYRMNDGGRLEAYARAFGFRGAYEGESPNDFTILAREFIAETQRHNYLQAALKLASENPSLSLPPKQDDPEENLVAIQEWCIQAKRLIQSKDQIVAPKLSSPILSDEPSPQDDMKSAKWFEDNTTVTGESLRKAVSGGRFLRTVGPKGKKRYSLMDAKAIWGDDVIHSSKRESA